MFLQNFYPAITDRYKVTVANSEVTMGRPLRDMEHRDLDGNVIGMTFCQHHIAMAAHDILAVDPDRSNPTRPRLERPLDTIRSFEAAIDGSYSRRQSYRTGRAASLPQASGSYSSVSIETPSASTAAQTRRTSYMSSQCNISKYRSNSVNDSQVINLYNRDAV